MSIYKQQIRYNMLEAIADCVVDLTINKFEIEEDTIPTIFQIAQALDVNVIIESNETIISLDSKKDRAILMDKRCKYEIRRKQNMAPYEQRCDQRRKGYFGNQFQKGYIWTVAYELASLLLTTKLLGEIENGEDNAHDIIKYLPLFSRCDYDFLEAARYLAVALLIPKRYVRNLANKYVDKSSGVYYSKIIEDEIIIPASAISSRFSNM